MVSKHRYDALADSVWFVKSYYDHPLSGYMTIQGKPYVFLRRYGSSFVRIRQMSWCESFRARLSATLFGIFVDWHWHMVQGKRFKQYKPKPQPWDFVCRVIYRSAFMIQLRKKLAVDLCGK